MKYLPLLAPILLFTGCETVETGDGTRTTRFDAAALNGSLNAINSGIGTYEHARAAYYGQPYQYQQSTYAPTP